MDDLKLKVPRLEAYDAVETSDGWCVDVEDLKSWLNELLNDANEFRSDDALYVLDEGIKKLIVHLS